MPGDEIILIGFSRGAFTARSIAGLIRDIGLLSRGGMEDFYAIFKDIQNSRNKKYHDIFPSIPFPDKPPPGRHMAAEYRERLLEVSVSAPSVLLLVANSQQRRLTRVACPDGSPIVVQAVAVWDTVGSLGIPTIG